MDVSLDGSRRRSLFIFRAHKKRNRTLILKKILFLYKILFFYIYKKNTMKIFRSTTGGIYINVNFILKRDAIHKLLTIIIVVRRKH